MKTNTRTIINGVISAILALVLITTPITGQAIAGSNASKAIVPGRTLLLDYLKNSKRGTNGYVYKNIVGNFSLFLGDRYSESLTEMPNKISPEVWERQYSDEDFKRIIEAEQSGFTTAPDRCEQLLGTMTSAEYKEEFAKKFAKTGMTWADFTKTGGQQMYNTIIKNLKNAQCPISK